MNKEEIDRTLLDFGIKPIAPSANSKYSNAIYQHFEFLARSFNEKDPAALVLALISKHAEPYTTQFVLYGQPNGELVCYSIVFPRSIDRHDSASFNGPPNMPDGLLQYFAEQSLYACHKTYVDNQIQIPTRRVFQNPPIGSEGAIRNLVIDENYTVRVHLHNVNVANDSLTKH